MLIRKDKISFALSMISFLGMPILFPKWHLSYFVPFIVLSYYQHTRIGALWRAALCGLIIDLLSSGPLFGITACNYCSVSFILYGQVRNFFEEKLSTLPIMTFLFSMLSTLINLLTAFFSGSAYPFSITWMATDLVGMAAADALFALLLFSIPFKLMQRKPRRETL